MVASTIDTDTESPTEEETTIFGFTITPTRRTILVQATVHGGRWSLPGGSVEDTDSGDTAALIREIGEETGIPIDQSRVDKSHRDFVYYLSLIHI